MFDRLPGVELGDEARAELRRHLADHHRLPMTDDVIWRADADLIALHASLDAEEAPEPCPMACSVCAAEPFAGCSPACEPCAAERAAYEAYLAETDHPCPREEFLDDPITVAYGVGAEMVRLVPCAVCDAREGR